MWRQGYTANGASYCAKVYDEGSKHGIGGGRVSKLEIRVQDDVVYRYDRGDDVPAVTQEALEALDEILAKYA